MNKVAVLFATGHSLTPSVVDICSNYIGEVDFFGCNDSYKIVPFLDVLYAADYQWWEANNKLISGPQKWTCSEKASEKYDLNYIEGLRKPDLCLNEFKVHYGYNSGYQLINLAYHFGVRKFLLVGYNMGGPHFFGEHNFSPMKPRSPYETFIAAFRTITLPGIVNCTPGSKLDAFPFGNLEEELALAKKYARTGG